MPARSHFRSLWTVVAHLAPGLVLAGALGLVTPGCRSPKTDEEAAPVAPAAPRSGAELRQVVQALVSEKGEDGYTDPRLDPVLKELEAAARAGDQDAKSLHALVWAKRRLALKATLAEREGPVVLEGSRGKVRLEGAAPETENARSAAEAITLGSSRQALVEAYGSCLVRQTWFKGRNGGPTTELFHVAPECRERLAPRTFVVANQQVTRVTPGNLDGVGEPREPVPGNEG